MVADSGLIPGEFHEFRSMLLLELGLNFSSDELWPFGELPVVNHVFVRVVVTVVDEEQLSRDIEASRNLGDA